MTHLPAPNSDLTHPKYRADIDGLRAIAILSVVFYHASPLWLRGGFVGVDIFFVISGFLISTIIFENLQRDSFSFLTFYSRRIRRIFPALILVLACCFAIGWFLLSADEYRQLGKHMAGGAGFVSNFVLWNESGYFDSASDSKPLLHLWSLGIEEQFYIVWPLLLWGAWKKNLNWLTITIVIILISFVLNLLTAQSDAAGDFYSPQTRFWELLTGALLANATLQRSHLVQAAKARLDQWLGPAIYRQAPAADGTTLRNAAALSGAALILAGLVLIDAAKPYPGTWALLPVLGTALVIAAGAGAWFNRTILASRLLVWFGLISYPLYLWHWPLLSFARIFGLVDSQTPSRGVRFAAVALAIALAWLTTIIVEWPMRRPDRGRMKTLILAALMILAGGAGYAAYSSGGIPSRKIVRDAAMLSSLDFYDGMTIEQFWHKTNGCFLMEHDTYDLLAKNGCEKEIFSGRKKVFLVGDSYAGYLSLGLKHFLIEKHLNPFQYTAIFCVPFTVHDARTRCNQINDHTLKMVDTENPDIVIMFANYASYPTDPQNHENISYDRLILQRTRDYVALGARKIIVVGQIPTWEDILPNVLLRRFVQKHRPIPERTFDGVLQASLDWDTKLRSLPYPPNVTYVSLRDFLCNAQGCLTRTGPDIRKDLIVQDFGHLTQAGADTITRKLLARYIP